MLSKKFKICRCCNTKANIRKRVCDVCGVPAIWDNPTSEQQINHDVEIERRIAFMEKLMEELA